MYTFVRQFVMISSLAISANRTLSCVDNYIHYSCSEHFERLDMKALVWRYRGLYSRVLMFLMLRQKLFTFWYAIWDLQKLGIHSKSKKFVESAFQLLLKYLQKICVHFDDQKCINSEHLYDFSSMAGACVEKINHLRVLL